MNPQLTTRLRTLRLSGMVDALPARVAQAESAPLAHLDFLELLVEDELSRRADRLFDRRVKQAGLTTIKTLGISIGTSIPNYRKRNSPSSPVRASCRPTAASY